MAWPLYSLGPFGPGVSNASLGCSTGWICVGGSLGRTRQRGQRRWRVLRRYGRLDFGRFGNARSRRWLRWTRRLRVRRLERSHCGGWRQPFLRRRTRFQILDVHFFSDLALIGRLLREILRQYQMDGLSEIGENFGGFPGCWTAQTRQQEYQRNNRGVHHQRANTRPPVPARVGGLVPVQQQLRTGIRA